MSASLPPDYHILQIPVWAGSYRIGDWMEVYFPKKPCWFHRFMTKLLLGWEWKDL